FFFSSRRRHTRSKRDWSSDVCSSDLLRSLDDDAGDPQSVRKRLELDALHPDRKRHTDLLAPLGSDLVRLHFLAAIGRGTDLISGEDEVVKMPEVVRVLDAELELAGPRVPMEHAHSRAPWSAALFLRVEGACGCFDAFG